MAERTTTSSRWCEFGPGATLKFRVENQTKLPGRSHGPRSNSWNSWPPLKFLRPPVGFLGFLDPPEIPASPGRIAWVRWIRWVRYIAGITGITAVSGGPGVPGAPEIPRVPGELPRGARESRESFFAKSALHNFFRALTPNAPFPMMCRCGITSRHRFRLTTEQAREECPKRTPPEVFRLSERSDGTSFFGRQSPRRLSVFSSTV